MSAPPHGGRAALIGEFEQIFQADGRSIDPHPIYRRLRRELPVFYSSLMDAWVVSRHADVRQVLRGADDFEVLPAGAGGSIHGRMVLRLAGREHQRKVAPIARHLRRRESLDGAVAESIARRVRDFHAAIAAADDGRIDLCEEFALFAARVICDIMGVERDASDLERWAHATARAGVGNPTGRDEIRDAGARARDEIQAAAREILESDTAAPDGLIRSLVDTEFEGRPMPDDEVLSNCSFLFTAGVETTARALASLFKEALSGQGALLAAFAEGHAGDETACLQVVAELLRMHPPVQGVFRLVSRPVTLAGRELATGDRVLVLLAAANRDERVFPSPDAFLPSRFAEPWREFTGGSRILSFGGGIHYCTGSLLAQREIVEVSRAAAPCLRGSALADSASAEDAGVLLRSPEHLWVSLEKRALG